MKNAVFIVVFILLARPVMPVLNYALNYNYIAKVLCVNKAKPQMHCNGKCHLMKELARAAEKEKPLNEKKAAAQQAEVLFFAAAQSFAFSCQPVVLHKKQLTAYCNLYSRLNSASVFRPPVVA